jgi:CDP-glucose 4,6-dehydratase
MKMWKNRNVLVTGATGLLGSHLADELQRQHAKVVCIIRDWIPTSKFYATDGLSVFSDVVLGDVEDYDLVNRTINEYQIQTVFHLAAQTQVGVANRNPVPTLRTNIIGTINVLEACRINKVEQVVIASSDKAYGSCTKLPYDEHTPLHGDHPYDVSKSCADLIAQSYRSTYGMNVGITRCGNLFGPGDLNFNRLIPGTIRSLLNDEAPVIRSDGKMTRDYFYVKDAVHAYLTLAQRQFDYPDLKDYEYIFNFSYGTPCSVLDMVETIGILMQNMKPPTILNEASNEIQEQYLDSSKAMRFLAWQPKWSMHKALEETIEWYKENL